MEVKLREAGNILVVSICGRLDTLSAPSFEKMVESGIAETIGKIILDLSDLEYVSSAGLRSFLVLGQKSKAQGGCVVCCSASGLVKKVLEISKFCEILPMFNSVEDALRHN